METQNIEYKPSWRDEYLKVIVAFANKDGGELGNGKYFIRSGSNNFELKGEELTNFLIEKSGKTWDEFMEEKAGFHDINPKTIDEFKKYAVDRIPSIVAEKDYQTILEKLNLQEDKKLKKAAILLFGKNPQRFYPAAYLKIGKFLTETDI